MKQNPFENVRCEGNLKELTIQISRKQPFGWSPPGRGNSYANHFRNKNMFWALTLEAK